MMWLIKIVEVVFGAGLFINALLFIPQIVNLWRTKNAKNISLITFIGFWILQLFSVFYGFIKHDLLMIVGFGCSLITCGMLVMLVIFYRYRA